MRPSRSGSLVLLIALLALPGGLDLVGAAAPGARSCATACGTKCCCRPLRAAGGGEMRPSCCGSLPSITTSILIPRGALTAVIRLAVPLPFLEKDRAVRVTRTLDESPAPPTPPPRRAC